MRIEFTLDCSDLDRTARFWQDAAGFTVTGTIEGRYISLTGLGVDLTLQRVPEAKTGKNWIISTCWSRTSRPRSCAWRPWARRGSRRPLSISSARPGS